MLLNRQSDLRRDPSTGTAFIRRVITGYGVAAAAMLAWLASFGQAWALNRQSASVSVKVLRYAEHLVDRYDADGDGKLQAAEWEPMRGNPTAADQDGDGVIVVQELAEHMAEYGARRRIRLMPALLEGGIRLPSLLRNDAADGGEITGGDALFARPGEIPTGDEPVPEGPEAEEATTRKYTRSGSRLARDLPDWFLQRDRDGDGQLTQAEFAPTAPASAMREFSAYDRNGDGIITARELKGGSSAPEPSRTEEPVEAAPDTPSDP